MARQQARRGTGSRLRDETCRASGHPTSPRRARRPRLTPRLRQRQPDPPTTNPQEEDADPLALDALRERQRPMEQKRPHHLAGPSPLGRESSPSPATQPASSKGVRIVTDSGADDAVLISVDAPSAEPAPSQNRAPRGIPRIAERACFPSHHPRSRQCAAFTEHVPDIRSGPRTDTKPLPATTAEKTKQLRVVTQSGRFGSSSVL